MNAASSDLRVSLRAIISRVTGGDVQVSPEQAGMPLQQLGVDSVTLLRFLVAVEDTFAVEWSPDDPQSAFESIDSLATYLVSSRRLEVQ